MPRRKSQESGCVGTVIAMVIGFIIFRACVADRSPSKNSRTQNSVSSTLSDRQIIQTFAAEIQLSYTPTITLTPAPSFTSADESTAEIALIPTLPPLEEFLSPTSAAQKYIVQDGDTCWGIAIDKYKIPLDAFLAANGISSAYCDISVGQEVVIPAAGDPIPTALPYVTAPVYAAPELAPVADYVAPTVAAPAANYVPADNCHPNYIGACIPMDRGDINCSDIPDKGFQWVNYDPYKLDRDKNGICCEN